MAKITMTLCDVAPCTFTAEREFQVNGETIYVCGENCFVKFWSREFRNWKNERYDMEAHLNIEQTKAKKVILNSSRENSPDLQVLKPARNLDSLKYIARVEP
jgi:hypothetical protein